MVLLNVSELGITPSELKRRTKEREKAARKKIDVENKSLAPAPLAAANQGGAAANEDHLDPTVSIILIDLL